MKRKKTMVKNEDGTFCPSCGAGVNNDGVVRLPDDFPFDAPCKACEQRNKGTLERMGRECRVRHELKVMEAITGDHVHQLRMGLQYLLGEVERPEEAPDEPDPNNPWAGQVGGRHYKDMAIQPARYSIENGLTWAEGEVVKYVSRWKFKGGLDDLRKARHILDLLIERKLQEEMKTQEG